MAMQQHHDLTRMTGPEKAAAFMLAIGEEFGKNIWGQLNDEEVKELSSAMSNLGQVAAKTVEKIFIEFATEVSTVGSLNGSFDTTERLLTKLLPDDRVNQIMDEIRGPAGRTMWDKLGNVNEVVLAAYLKNEYPQTVAVVLQKIKPEHAARVLAVLPEWSCACCAWRRCRRTSWTRSSRPCGWSS